MSPTTTLPRFHMALLVRNIKDSIAFYRQLFDMEPTKVRNDYAKFEVLNPSVNFTLNQTIAEVFGHGGLSHFGIQVADHQTLDTQRTRLQGLGLPVRLEEKTSCCYALQDKFWITDPDGHEIEFFLVLEANTDRKLADSHSDRDKTALNGCEEPTQRETCCT